MKHLEAVIAALLLLVFAGVTIWFNRHALGMVPLSFAGGAIVVAFLLAIPADAAAALTALAKLLPVARGQSGGSGGAS